MSWQDNYASKLTTMEDAVKMIRSGDTVVIPDCAGEPVELVDIMVDYVVNSDVHDVKVHTLSTLGHAKYAQPGMEKYFKVNLQFLAGATRDCINSGRGDFTPCFLYQMPELYIEKYKPDILLAHLSKPDKDGFCSFGVSCEFTKPVADNPGTKVIAVVSDNMPRTFGDNFIHVNDLTAIVEADIKVPEIPLPKIGEVERAIGENVASLVRDGDCLQLGIGSIPDAVLSFLGDKKDLGIHSEMISDGVVDLYEKGVINCKAKNINKGKMTVAFLMGTRRLYDFVDNNPAVQMMPLGYTNNPSVIGMNDNFVSINSALEVDLQGQVCAEAMGLKQFTGIGGQVDFLRGAAYSKGGRSILAFPATARGGSISKVVPFLTQGAPVTSSRCDVDYVVTEYGIAKLKWNTLRERARQLINIAAPQFREALAEEYEKRFFEKF